MIRAVRERETNYCQQLKLLHVLLFIFVSFFTTSCSSGVLNPKGEIASYELKLLIAMTRKSLNPQHICRFG